MIGGKKDLISLTDYSKADMLEIIKTAQVLKKNRHGDNSLKDKVIALIFSKSSTRTRLSFEVGINELGGTAIFLSAADIQIGRGESIYDTAKVMERYVDGVVIRTFSHQELIDFAQSSRVSVINGLTDSFHPCQALADMLTVLEQVKPGENIKFAYIGDGNNMANSLALACETMEIPFHIATPKGYECDPQVVRACPGQGHFTNDPLEAITGAQVVYTDVWASMGQEEESEARKEIFKNFQINDRLTRHADANFIFLHCLPAHRGEEVSKEIIDGPHSRVFDQAENRLHVQKAILKLLLSNE